MTEERVLQRATRTLAGEWAGQGQHRKFYIKPVNAPALPVQLGIKRAADILCALSGLIVLSPVFLLIAALVKTSSSGPVFSRKICTSRDDVPFDLLQFRCLASTVSAGQRAWQMTRFCRILRMTRLEQLPRLWNVLVGDMSLIGPQPHIPDNHIPDTLADGQSYRDLVDGYEYRHAMRPGLTGLAQVRGASGPTPDGQMAIREISCDIEYIQEFSLVLDLKIIWHALVTAPNPGTAC